MILVRRLDDDGFSEINALHTFHRTARSEAEGTKLSLERTSIDMSMVGLDLSFTNATTALLEEEPDILERLKESGRRVIKLKLQLGLYDDPRNNDSTLPLSKDASAFLTGHSAHNIGYQCGGWARAGDYTDEDLAAAKQYASLAEYTVAVIGEEVYEEKTGDIDDLALHLGQIEYVKALASTGTKVIVVLFEGRLRILNDIRECLRRDQRDAFV
ncbi:hypothetical protein PHYPSEUDO_015246 [Phytophthora pseudosyringae]|uniref:beta-glucosidase n=1 Tax=Phytophthora pseudosyringae TaxID=221518 RepID=A0A8T1V6R3_9STRA|nr:hypothetical protein PHYPSEUDO_015246 [Phytophthora pseudosyringae]